ncbi:AAA family ATPase [Streptomyces sp. NRRL F-2747]|uniref:AAA family ATPase n=1 Tax=Streptomyces sp. NRRL F-2747 TaxID=1463843 RepID=UPI0004C62CF7|nr:AAA family ATPase [Streptomyces sp. NRRL F-2747]
MASEFVAPSPGTGAAHGRTSGTPEPGLRADARFAVRADGTAAYDETEVAESFDVHALAVGPVLGYPDADTAGEADRVAAVLERLGGTAVSPLPRGTDPAQPDEDDERLLMSLTEADEALARWAGERRDHAGRPSVLLWFGHGVPGSTGPALLVPDAGRKQRNARVTPDMFAYYLHAEQQRRDTEEGHWAIVVIEACNAKNFAKELHARFLGSRAPELCSLLLVATGKAAAQGYLGTFRKALESYLAGKSWQDKVHTLRELQCHLKSEVSYAELVGEETSRELPLRLRNVVPLDGAVTVAEQQRQQKEFDGAPAGPPFGGRERAVHEAGIRTGDDTGFLEVVPDFTGRTAELAAVAAWCAGPEEPPVLVVTGAPGTGKSALLGELLRRLRRGTDPAWAGMRVAAVLRLTGSTAADVVRQLTQSLGAGEGDEPTVSTPGGPDHDPLAPLRRRLAASPVPGGGVVPTLILADALDEAREPFQVASLLRDLTEEVGVRLLIGTRNAPYDEEEHGGGADLRAALGSATGRARVLELAADPEATTAYTARRVEHVLREHPVGDAAHRRTVVRTVCEAVERHVREGSWQFLHAALAVGEIEQRPQVLGPDTAERSALEQLLASDRTGLFGAAVARITSGLPTADSLMRALALAQGRGLPRADGVWAHAAAGVAGRPQPSTEEELSLFLSRAAAYVLLDGEDRRSVYRLAHHTYTEQLLATSTREQRLGMLTALLDLAAEQCAGGQSVSPHLEARLAQYAADCGAPGWEELAGRPAVLDRLPVAGLSGLALAPGGGDVTTPADLPIEVLGTVASAHLIRSSAPADRPGLRQLGGLRAAGRLHPAGAGAAWEVRWGRLRALPPHLKLDGTDGAVSALTAHASAPWLVTGALDGTVVVWEPWRAHRPALLLRGCERPVSALAALGGRTGDERPGLLLAAHDDRTLQLWDTGHDDQPTLRTVTTTGGVVRVAAGLPNGIRRFALGGDSGYLALLDADGPRAKALSAVPSGDVVGLTPLTSAGGRQWLASAHRSGELVLWDVHDSEPVRLTSLHTRRTLTTLAAVTGALGTLRLVTAAADGPVEFWRVKETPDDVLLMAAPQPDAENLHARLLARLPAPDGDTLVVGDIDGNVHVLGPAGGPPQPAGGGIPRAMTTAVLRGPDDGAVLATAVGRDPLVHLWVPAPSTSTDPGTRWPHVSRVQRHMTADGTEVLLVRESDGLPAAASAGSAVRVLRAADGEDLTDRVRHETLPVLVPREDVACPWSVAKQHTGRVMGWVMLEGGPGTELWASLGRKGDVVVWRREPSGSHQLVHRIPLGAPGLHLTALTGGRLAVTTDDGIAVLAIGAVASRGDDARTEDTHG